jgi:hypothetical protein
LQLAKSLEIQGEVVDPRRIELLTSSLRMLPHLENSTSCTSGAVPEIAGKQGGDGTNQAQWVQP